MFHKPPIIYLKIQYVILLRILLIIIAIYSLSSTYDLLINDAPFTRSGVVHTRTDSPALFYSQVLKLLAIGVVSLAFTYNIRDITKKPGSSTSENK